jgi:Trypsin-like peptidase domain
VTMLPEFYFDAVVSLEQKAPDEDDGEPTFAPMGSGVLLGRHAEGLDEEGQPRGAHIYLATNRHVIEGHDVVHAKFNVGSDAPAERFDLLLQTPDGTPLWFGIENVDVAVTYLSASDLANVGVRIAPIPEDKWIGLGEMQAAEIGPGDEVFVLGFPLGLAGRERKYVIVRGGMIARLDEELIAETHSYLIDCTVFPGNSGGPVFRKPQMFINDEAESIHLAWYPPDFIGIVSNYLPYRDTAWSLQTQAPRVIFEENSGLASVVPVDAIRVAIEEHEEFERHALAKPEAEGAEDGGEQPRGARLERTDEDDD